MRRRRQRFSPLRRRPVTADDTDPVVDSTLERVLEKKVEPASSKPQKRSSQPEGRSARSKPKKRPTRPEKRPKLRDRLGKARAALGGSLASILNRSTISEEVWDELVEALIRADVGVSTAVELTDTARAAVSAGSRATPTAAIEALRNEIRQRLAGSRDLERRADDEIPSVWLFVGVNGSGKTTSIGKLAKQQIDDGARVMLAAGDTFRAAAAEQLAIWAQRAGAEIVEGAVGGDPSSVVYDAVESAAAKGCDLVMADTAGRLHTERNLMDELRKMRRVAEKGAGVVTETLLVLDATTGQNGLAQARKFTQAVDISGVILTKLDGSAKGGIVIAVQAELGIPVKYVGVGEGIVDLVPFDEAEFTEALFG